MPTFDNGSNNTSVVYTDPTALCGSPLISDPKLTMAANQTAFRLPVISNCAQFISMVWAANMSKQIAWVIDAGGGLINLAGQCLPGDRLLTAIRAIITTQTAALQGAVKDCTGNPVPTGTNMASCLDLSNAVAQLQAKMDALKIIGFVPSIAIFASSTNSGTVSEVVFHGTWVLTGSSWTFVFAVAQIQVDTGYTVVMPAVGTVNGSTPYTYYNPGTPGGWQNTSTKSGWIDAVPPSIVNAYSPWVETTIYTKTTTGITVTKTHTEGGTVTTTYPKADFTAAR